MYFTLYAYGGDFLGGGVLRHGVLHMRIRELISDKTSEVPVCVDPLLEADRILPRNNTNKDISAELVQRRAARFFFFSTTTQPFQVSLKCYKD